MPTIAVVGASSDRSKFGNKCVRAYRKRGWTVLPVNPKEKEIEGLPAFAALKDVPGPLDAVSLYLPPAIGLGILDQVASQKPRRFFVNPGAGSPELESRARALGLDPLLACAIVAVGESPADY